jgi:hypothetical protein
VDALHLAHLVLLSMWAGIVVAETVVEVVGRRHVEAAALMHYWIDLLLELPVIAGVLTTGTLLTLRAWPLSTLHQLKIAAGLIAVGANLYCAVAVVQRRHARDMSRYRLRIQLSLAGAPFALAAAYIGLRFVR